VQAMSLQLIDNLRQDNVKLVAKSHSSISIQSCAELLGLSHEGTVARCQSLGWSIQGDFIKPVELSSAKPQTLNADQLQALTGERSSALCDGQGTRL
jgi:hypothetical protein